MAIDLGRWFRDRKRQVEGVAAQVNPFDNGKTYSSVVQNTPVQTSTQVNQRSAQPPSNRTSNLINPQKPTWLDNQAFTVSSRPIAQPNFQAPKPNGSLQQEIDKSYGRGLSSLKNRLRDVVDSNTQADRIRRVAQTGLDESYQDQQARLTRDAMSRKDGDNIGAQTSGAFFKEGASFVGKSPSSIAQIQARVASSNNPLIRYGVGAVVPGAQYGLLPGGNKRGEQILRASQGINTTIDNKLQQSGLGDRADHNKWARGAGSVGFQLPALLATGPLGLAGMGSQTAADEANKAEMAGRTNEQALGIGLLQGGASMASEKFGLDRFLPGNGTAATSIKPFLGNMAKRIGTEGAQEAQQQFTQNLISNKTYNPNQGLKEGVFESAVLGGLSGGAMSGAIDLPNVTRNTNIKLSPLDESGFIDVPKQDLIIRNGDGTANSITVYHGGAGADEISRNGVKILSPDEKMKYPSSGGGYVGLSTSADKNYAQQFSQNIAGHDRVAEIKIRSDARILELPEGKMIDDMSADELTKLSKQYDVIKSTEDNEYRILNETAIASGGGKAMSVEKDPLEAIKQEARKYKSAEEFADSLNAMKYGKVTGVGQLPVSKINKAQIKALTERGLPHTDTNLKVSDFKPGRQVTQPLEVYSKGGSWVVENGNHRLAQALANGDEAVPVVFKGGEGKKYSTPITDLYNQAHAEANTKSSNMSDRLLESTDPADIEMRRSLSGKNRPKGAFEIEQNQQMTDEQRLQATGGDIGQAGISSDPEALARAKAKLAEAVKESRAETKKKESKALIQITPTGAKAVDTRNKNIAQGGLPKLEQSQHPQTKQSNPTQTKLANQGKAAQNGNQQSQTGQSPDTQSNHSYAKPIKNFDTKQYIIEQVNAQKVSTKPSIKNMINNFIDKSKHVFVDDAVAYERYIKDKDKRASIREGVDQVRGSSMMARQFAEDNGMNELGKMSTKDLNEFQQYLIAKRSAELEARGIKTGRNLDADQSLIKDVGNKYDTQENIIRDYSNKMLDYSVDNGLISAELRDKLITENPNYVPMNRVMDAVNENSGFKSKQLGSLSQQTVVQKIEGSERTVENPIESLLLNTERMMNESARNRVARQLASESDLTERVINDGDKVRDGYDTLSYLDNGKKVRVEVPALVAQEMRNLNSVMPDWLETSMRLAGAPTKLLRSGATSANPIFAVSNLVRDQIQTAITGKVIANVKGTPKAFVAAFSPSAKGRALRAELRRNGIVGSEYRQTYGSKSGQLMQELQTHNKLGMKAVSKLKHPIESIADVIGATEYFTRAQQFYGTDGDVIARAQAARNNSLNFSRAGVLVRQMNRVIPFLNAGVQGGRITVNTIKNRPVKAAASTATMLGVALAVKALAQAQDDELYERLRDEEKKNNLIIFKPDAHYDPDSNRVEGIVKVPMPQMLYPLLDGVNNVKGKPEDLLRVAGDIFTAVSGIDATNPISQLTPTVVKPAVEIGLNKDLYTGMDLVSDYEKNKNPEDIAAKYGTQPARKLAETTGLPAPYFDNIFKNFGGGLAKDLTLALGKNPDNKRSGKGITGMLEGGLDRRFGSAGITSQYDIQSKLAEGYKDQLRNNSTFKSLSTDDQSKVLDKVDYDTKSIAGIMAKTEQNRNSEIKKDLSDRQKDIVEKGFNPDRFMQSIESGNKGKKDKTDYYKSNDAEYNSFKKEYDDKIKNNEYTKAGKIKAENKLRKLEVGKPYSKDARDLYDINKSQLAKWLSTDEKGVDKQKLHDELIAYDQALYDAGLIKYKKFKGGVATGRNGKGGSRKGGGKSKIDIAQILSKSNLQVQHSQNLSKLLAGTTFKGTKTKPSTSKNKSKVAQKTIKVDMRA